MPVLRRKIGSKSYYIRSRAGGKMTTYQVTATGIDRLRSMGFENGSKISHDLVVALFNKGLLYTGGTGPGDVDDLHRDERPALQDKSVKEFLDRITIENNKRSQTQSPICDQGNADGKKWEGNSADPYGNRVFDNTISPASPDVNTNLPLMASQNKSEEEPRQTKLTQDSYNSTFSTGPASELPTILDLFSPLPGLYKALLALLLFAVIAMIFIAISRQ